MDWSDDDAGAVPGRGARLVGHLVAALGRHFGNRVRGFARIRTSPLPLVLDYWTLAAGGQAIGNAAQTPHPVAGQGFNPGLRDAWSCRARVDAGA
jgi:2-octaprenyl-6-methoxyphenol hydroxylase